MRICKPEYWVEVCVNNAQNEVYRTAGSDCDQEAIDAAIANRNELAKLNSNDATLEQALALPDGVWKQACLNPICDQCSKPFEIAMQFQPFQKAPVHICKPCLEQALAYCILQ
jgi:hypothetical protein